MRAYTIREEVPEIGVAGGVRTPISGLSHSTALLFNVRRLMMKIDTAFGNFRDRYPDFGV